MNTPQTKRGFTTTPTLVPFRFLKTLSMSAITLVQKLTLIKNDHETKKQHQSWCRGFTLVEMIVSLGLFTIVLFITTSAFLAIVNADRKSRATRVATDNLNLALENMSRKIKTGYTYNCGGGSGANDCVVPQSIFEFTDQSGSRVSYKRAQGTAECGSGYGVNQGCILRLDAGVPVLSTSPEIDITSLKFLVSGSALWPDTKQPAVVIAIEGAIGVNAGNPSGKSSFKIQTILTQRIYDH